MELADLVVINKADLDSAAAARARAQIHSALRLLGMHGNPYRNAHEASCWQPQVLQVSGLKGNGLEAFWQAVCQYRQMQQANGQLAARRQRQSLAWMWERIDAGLRQAFRSHEQVRQMLPALQGQVQQGQLAASTAARQLLHQFGGVAAAADAVSAAVSASTSQAPEVAPAAGAGGALPAASRPYPD